GFDSKEMIQANVAVVGSDGRVRDRFFNRVMFPINDEQGQCIAFGGRVIGKGEPKYLNSQETPLFHKGRMLYALDKAKAAMASTGVAVVSEGYTDVIAMHDAGIRNAVATLGTALTRTHIRVLSRHARNRIVYLFDGDAAGQRAADRALQFIDSSMTPEAGAARIDLFAVTLPDNLDPAEFIDAHGGQELQALIDQAKPLLEYGIDRRLGNWDLSRAEGRSGAVADALSVLAPIKDSLLAKDYARQIASRARADEKDVLEQLAALKPPRVFDAEAPAGGGANDRGTPVAPMRRKLPQSETNRRRFERQLLALCAARTDLALTHADALASVQWHDPACAAVSASMLDTLAEDPCASPAAIVSAAAVADPRASGFLTRGVPESAVPEDLASFLVEELSIGDAEEAVAAMRAQMSAPASMSAEDSELLFETVAAMQRELTARKRAHAESATSSR
ncbi:toprim domain-containing protein, partial [uncultured Senegalimassilia sp.]|uniref:DNA primase n=1 Tax=uncultured Senegalimassilia sp. TaxID=1714350 RepID=UPI0026008C6B